MNFSGGLGAVFEIGLLIRATFAERGDRAHWISGFMAWHKNIHWLLQMHAGRRLYESNCPEPWGRIHSLPALPCVVGLMIDTASTR